MAIANRLKEARAKAGLSREQVSDWLHVPLQRVSQWESGVCEPKISELAQCAAIYGTTLDWLCERNSLEEPQKRQPSRMAFQMLLILLAGSLVAVAFLLIQLRQLQDSNGQLREQRDYVSINDPFYDNSLPIWDPNHASLVTVDPETVQTPPADKTTDTYETRRFEITIKPGKVYQITDFLSLPAGSMVTIQAEYVPAAGSVRYGLMNRDWEAMEALTHNEIHGRLQVPEAGEYCLYLQNGSEEVIEVQGYYTYLAVDAHTPVIQR